MRQRTEGKGGGGTQLKLFFEGTPFVPFKAVFDGRQDMNDIIVETPWLQLSAGFLAGLFIEKMDRGIRFWSRIYDDKESAD